MYRVMADVARFEIAITGRLEQRLAETSKRLEFDS